MKTLLAVIAAAVAAWMAGCVEREMTITSEPAGALVFLSDVEVGRTPVTVPFTWYGDYDIIVRREGRKTITDHAQIGMPWYEFPPLDLFSAIAPWTYHDRRYLHYTMEKLVLPGDDELILKADEMRERNRQPVKK